MGVLRAAAVLLLLAAPARAGAPRFATDPRVDLMGLVQRLSGDQRFGVLFGRAGGYGKEGLEDFARFRHHAAVERLRRMKKAGFSGNIPAQLSLYLSPPPALEEAAPIPDFFAQAAGGRAQLDAFLSDLRAFARETGFAGWLAARQEQRDALAAAARDAAGPEDLEALLAGYLGVRTWKSLTVAPSPFFPPGKGSYWVVETDEGLPEVHAIIGPQWRRGRPAFAPRAELASAIWREAAFSTAYLMYSLCRPGPELARDVCWGTRRDDPEDCVEQVWVEAVTARLRQRAFGARADDRRYWRTRSQYMPAELRVLEAYERGCAEPRDIVALTPRLLAPLQGGAEPAGCPRLDLGPAEGALYRRRLGWYRQALLERPAGTDRCGR
jgi:hypothetical protein